MNPVSESVEYQNQQLPSLYLNIDKRVMMYGGAGEESQNNSAKESNTGSRATLRMAG